MTGRWFLICAIVGCTMLGWAGASTNSYPWSLDLQGNAQYSRYNFTDLVKPYNGGDAWVEWKVTYWCGTNKQFAPYINVIPVYATENDFWWQRNVQVGGGLQYYPLAVSSSNVLRGLRLFVWAGKRLYYDKPADADPEESDLQVGADYYWDNVFNYHDNVLRTNSAVAGAVFMNATYRRTNFSQDDYEGILWMGNVKVGHLVRSCPRLFPYVVADWTFSPSHKDFWYENFIRVGAGARWYPMDSTEKDGTSEMLARLNVFVEVLQNAAWLGDVAPDSVEKTDYRVGVSFSTGMFNGNR